MTRLPPTVSRRAHRRGEPFWIDIRKVVSPFGFSYGDGGWHPYWATIEELRASGSIDPCQSALARFMEEYRPESAQEALFGPLEVEVQPLPHLAPRDTTILWSVNRRVAARLIAHSQERARAANSSFGPLSRDHIVAEYRKLVGIHESVERHGYRPEAFDDGLIEGYFLIDSNDYRFVPSEGQHRIGVLRALEIDRILVRVRVGLGGVDRRLLHRWTAARGGPFSEEGAQTLFERYFDVRGFRSWVWT